MKLRMYIAVVTALAAVGMASAAASPHAFKSVEILYSDGAKLRCSVGQDGNRLYVLAPTGIEVFEQSGSAIAPDISPQAVQFLRSGDLITIVHRGGVATFKKNKANHAPDQRRAER